MKSVEYLAGFFDGEGYVGCKYQVVWDSYAMSASVTNNHRGVLLLFQEQFGGTINTPKDYGLRAGKRSWVWTAHGENLQRFLSAIAPHVVVKKPQVDLALRFPFGSRGQKVTPEMQAIRREVFLGLQELKGKVWTAPKREDYGEKKDLAGRADVQRAVTLYRQGLTVEEVAEQIGATPGAISYWMRQLGISRSRTEAGKIAARKRSDGVNSPEAEEAAHLYAEGLSAAEVARRLGKKPATVNYWLRSLGLTRPLTEAQRLRRRKEAE